MRKTKIFMVTILAMLLIFGGCKSIEENKEESRSVQKTEDDKTDRELIEKEQEETKTLDDINYDYSDDTNVVIHLFEAGKKKKIMVTITCNNSELGFACLCYIQSAITLASINEEIDYIIMLDNEGDSFGELRQGGEIQKITEFPYLENISPSEEETEKSIEYSGKLDEFIKRNNLK